MHLAIAGMRLLETIFFVGIAGSSVVVIISFIEDIHELFGDDEVQSTTSGPAKPAH